MFADLPQARPDDGAIRASIRALRAADGLLLGVLDDDPTGSQSVHDVQVVTVLDEDAYRAALDSPLRACFVLTNTRSLDAPAAASLTTQAARGLLAVARRSSARIQLVSRSDSTLRGHVLAEVEALHNVRRDVLGSGFDGVLLIPAFVEAERVTAADVHWARVGPEVIPVGQTEFARDAAFGYVASNLRDFLAEKSDGRIDRDDVGSISLDDIRRGGPARVSELLASARDGKWIIVNATEYSDLDIVAYGALLAERAGRSLLFRTGPSFVRALIGLEPRPPLRGQQIRSPVARAGLGGGHGLIVVGSHVSHTSRQLAALLGRGGTTGVELAVPAVLTQADDAVTGTAQQVARALHGSDVVLYTSRAVASGRDGADSLAIARRVSAALARVVREALAARPTWVVAKGGITSHDVARYGLDIRRAEVTGQLFPGVISVFRPIDAAPLAVGVPYVVFAGNVGTDETLADVVDLLRGAQPEPGEPNSAR